MGRNIVSLAKLEPAQVRTIVNRSVAIAKGQTGGAKTLQDKMVGIYFSKTSTRTRTSFTVGALKLGAQTIAYGPHDLQLNTGESIEDTTRVLAGYLDVLVVRTAGSQHEMEILGSQDDMSVINAMSESEHPTQALADLSTMQEHFGRLEGLKILYVGEGNNTAVALALAASRIPGMQLALRTPPGYGLPAPALAQATAFAKESNADVTEAHHMDSLPVAVDVVYTTRWQTTGTFKADEVWHEKFRPFSVTQALMEQVATSPGSCFMHDLPAVRGEDVDSAVIDGPQSIVFRQSRHKMFSAMAALEWCLLADSDHEKAFANGAEGMYAAR